MAVQVIDGDEMDVDRFVRNGWRKTARGQQHGREVKRETIAESAACRGLV
jgi:hypothetical protein